MTLTTDIETLHAERVIRRRLDAAGFEYATEDERETLKQAAIDAGRANKGGIAYKNRDIEQVVKLFQLGTTNAAGVEGGPRTPDETGDNEPDTDETTTIDTSDLPGPTIKALADNGITTIEELKAWKDDNGVFTGMRGVGVSSADKLDALIEVSPESIEGQQDESTEANESPQAPS